MLNQEAGRMKRAVWLLTAVVGVVILTGCGGGGGGGVAGPANAGTILYLLEGQDGFEVRMIAPDGSNDELVDLSMLGNTSLASISPDGRYLVFNNSSGIESTFSSELWVRNLEDNGQRRVFVSSTLHAEYCSVSHDSSRIVFTALEIHWSQPNGPRELYAVNIDGTGLRKLTSGSSGMGMFWPSFSPDGTRIMCEYNGVIVIMNSDGSGAVTLRPGHQPNYSPDGAEIVFEVSGLITICNVDGSNFRQLPGVTGDSWADCPCFSPDGTQIAFSSYSDADRIWQIYIVDSDGGNLRKLTSVLGPGDVEDCSWGGT